MTKRYTLIIHPDIQDLVAAGVLTVMESHLYATIDGLVQYSNEPCWANNATLAERLGIHPQTVTDMLGKLERLGLISRTYQGPHGSGRQINSTGGKVKHILDGTPIIGQVGERTPLRQPPYPPYVSRRTIGKKREEKIDSCGPSGGKQNTDHVVDENTNNTRRRLAKREAANAGEDRDNTGGQMGFIHDQTSNVLPPGNTATDLANADQLRASLVAGKRLSTQYKQQDWATQFRLLRDKDKHPQTDIDATLGWFCQNVTGQYTPKVYNATEFRQKYPRIVDVMERATREERLTAPTPISGDALQIIKDLGGDGNFLWPENTDASQYPSFVELSLQALRAYKQQLRDLSKTIPANRLRYDYHHVDKCNVDYLVERLTYPTELVKWWVSEVHRMAWDWPDWAGNLRRWVWSPDRKAWRWLVEDWARDCCGRKDGLDYLDPWLATGTRLTEDED